MNSRTYFLADGTYRLEVYLQPINYRTADGSWGPIDTTLGAPSEAGFAYSNQTNTLKTHLPASAKGWTRVECQTGAMSFRPLNAADAPNKVDGSESRLPAVWNAADIAYSVGPGLLKESITLNSSAAPAMFAFALRFDKLVPRLEANGLLRLMDADGAAVFTIPPPWMEDAGGSRCTEIRVDLVPQSDGYVYALSPSRSWLAKARYPVIVDPTIVTANSDLMATLDGTVANADTQFVGGTLKTTCDYRQVHTSKVGAVLDPQDFNRKGVRTLMHFLMPTLPKDIDIVRALLNLQFFGGDSVPVIAYALPREFHSPQDTITWNSINDYLAEGLPTGPASPETTLQLSFIPCSASGWPSGTVDVTSTVQDWIDRGGYYGIQGQGGGTTGPTILLRSAIEDDTTYNARTIEFFGPSLSITYMNLGWYMFQGNMKHTGYTQYATNPDAVLQWKRAVPTQTGGIPQGFNQISGLLETPPLAPSVVAVTNSANPSSTLPVVYVATTDGTSTELYRLVDQGTSVNDSDPNRRIQIDNFAVKGTPLVIPGTSATVADKAFLVGVGTGPDSNKVKVYRLDATFTNGVTTWTQPWSGGARVIDSGTTLISPAYYTGNTRYTRHNLDGTTTIQGSQGGAVVVAYDDNRLGGSYMIALSIANGYNVWGHVDTSGNLVDYQTQSGPHQNETSPGGLPRLQYPPSTYSSPVLMNDAGYINDYSCYVNARHLTDGSYYWDNLGSNYTTESTMSIFGGYLYYAMSEGVTEVDSFALYPDHYNVPYPILAQQPYPVWSSGAFSPNDHCVIFGDDAGRVFAQNTIQQFSTDFGEKWPSPYVATGTQPRIRSSALISGVPGSATNYAFVGADDQFVHVLETQYGTLYSGNDGASVLVGEGRDPVTNDARPLLGSIRASMAAFRGRLYVVTLGPATGFVFPYVYCFQ